MYATRFQRQRNNEHRKRKKEKKKHRKTIQNSQPIEPNSQNLIYDMRIRECAYVSKFKLLFYRIERE